MTTPFRTILLSGLVAGMSAFAATPAAAACYADYRARTEDPLRLHYGVIEVPDAACSVSAAAPLIAQRIGADGWQLLQVISVFDESGLDARRPDAGAYFLRY
ncbi:hypothetical protein P6F26_00135 [Roseibacterium sp. SDUM158017]|uniref:hypothetical protein n=1 Tax=Roseicyclus salinarum TaxID=3036773 RepID=UPI002414EFF4|nr:hypothetical protein [Roseibacterium sp. SDUM158017]MDG4646836.1 hypothetical protein [Roseibacterium sp. SDUM158017]